VEVVQAGRKWYLVGAGQCAPVAGAACGGLGAGKVVGQWGPRAMRWISGARACPACGVLRSVGDALVRVVAVVLVLGRQKGGASGSLVSRFPNGKELFLQ